MVFTRENVHIVMHQGTPNEFIIYVRHPYHRTIAGIERVPHFAYMAQSIPIADPRPYRQSMIRPIPSKKKILLNFCIAAWVMPPSRLFLPPTNLNSMKISRLSSNRPVPVSIAKLQRFVLQIEARNPWVRRQRQAKFGLWI
jgi:hypothetical protein